jgi:hypothetical protein
MDKKDDFKLSIKELKANVNIKFTDDIEKIQNTLVSFCMNVNLFQNNKNIYELNLTEQFKFNDCVEHVLDKIKSDISDLESFYGNCKQTCLDKHPDLEDNIDDYIKKSSWMFQPDLHPCLENCTSLFKGIYKKYIKYMTVDNGIYFEHIDYKNKII